MSLFSSIFLDCFPDGSALSLNCRPSSPFCYPPSSSIYTLLISLFLLLFSPLLSFLLIFPFFPSSLLPVLYQLLLFLLLIFSFSFSSCSYSSLPFLFRWRQISSLHRLSYRLTQLLSLQWRDVCQSQRARPVFYQRLGEGIYLYEIVFNHIMSCKIFWTFPLIFYLPYHLIMINFWSMGNHQLNIPPPSLLERGRWWGHLRQAIE